MNQVQRYILASGESEYEVSSFVVENYGVSKEYQLKLNLNNTPSLPPLNSLVCLQAYGCYFYGYINSILRDYCGDYANTTVIASSPLTHFLNVIDTVIYSRKKLDEIIEQILVKAGVEKDTHFVINIENADESLWSIQEQSSTLAFLQQLCSVHEIAYFYEQDKNGYKINFCDHQKLPQTKKELIASPNTGLAQKNCLKVNYIDKQIVTKSFINSTYDPTTTTSFNENIECGQTYATGVKECTKDKDFYLYLKTFRDASSIQLTMTNIKLNPLDKIAITNLGLDQLTIFAMHIYGKQNDYVGSKKITQTKPALMVDVLLQEECHLLPEPIFTQPSNLHTSYIEQKPSTIPKLSDAGEYIFRLNLDRDRINTSSYTLASKNVRNALYFAGNDYGFSMPYHDKTEVLVTFANGKMQDPIILGALANKKNKSVVTDTNNAENVLRTQKGSELIFTEESNSAKIMLQTPKHDTKILISDDKSKKLFAFSTEKGDINANSLKELSLDTINYYENDSYGTISNWCHDDTTLCVDNGHFFAQNKGSFTVRTRASLVVTAPKVTFVGKLKFIINGRESLQLSSKSLHLATKFGKMLFAIKQGNIKIKTNNSVRIKTSGSHILLNSNQIIINSQQQINLL